MDEQRFGLLTEEPTETIVVDEQKGMSLEELLEEQAAKGSDPLLFDLTEEEDLPPRRARHAATAPQNRMLKRVLAGVGIGIGSVLLLVVATFLMIFYSPWFHEQRDQYILMTYRTSNPWLCTLFFSQETIDRIFEENGAITPDADINPDLINPTPDAGTDDPTPPKTFAPISEKYGGEVIYDDGAVQIVKFSGKTTKGKYTARVIQILDPSRVTLGQTKKLGNLETGAAGKGQTILEMCEDNDALCGINAGGFLDVGGVGTGGIPLGTVVKDGVMTVYADDKVNGKLQEHTLIGFNEDDVLVMGNFTEDEVKEHRIRDAMSWRDPAILILNGVMTEFKGLAGGYDPRSAIGQRADGTVLLLVVDGSTKRSIDGANYALLADIMNEYGAVNAANLDGGTSSIMALNGKVINSNCNPSIAHRGRYLATGWLVKRAEGEQQPVVDTTRTTASVTAGSTVGSKATTKPSPSTGTSANTSAGTSAGTSASSDTTAGTSALSGTSASSGTSATIESTTAGDTGTTGEPD